MHIICLQKNLKQALSICERIIGKNLTLPILNNILLSIENKRLRVSSTNLEIGINCWVSGKIEKEGEITVPARLLSNFVGNLPNKKVELKVKDSHLTVKCENHRANLKGLAAKDFPIIPKITENPLVEIKGDILKSALTQVVEMAAFSESRPEISGIYLNFDKSQIKFVATDSFRLAEKVIGSKNKFNNQSIIVPQRTITELIRVISDEEVNNVKIILGNNQILFDLDYCQIISRLIEGRYPDYQQIIPKESKTQATINKEELLNAVRIASLFSSKINDVKFVINPAKKQIEISAKDVDLGEDKSSLKADIRGPGLEIAFNYRYVLDGLNNILSDKVVFNLNSNAAPVVARPVGDKSYTYMIMPIKIQ